MIKSLKIDKKYFGDFYSPQRLIDTHKPLCMCVGGRTIGKSTGTAIASVLEYLTLGKKWIYTRRSDPELQATCSDFFFDAGDIISSHGETVRVIYNGGEYFINDEKEPCGYAVNLGVPRSYKSIPYGGMGVRNIIFDEFILPRGDERYYIGSSGNMIREYERLTTLYQTVDRKQGQAVLNETRIFCLGNNSSFCNPLFIGCGCDNYVNTETKFCNPKSEIWALELVREVQATREIEKSYGYQMATAEDRQNYYFNDSYHVDNLVGKRTGIFNSLCNLTYHGENYGVYVSRDMGYVYVCRRFADGRPVLKLTVGDTTQINQVTAYEYRRDPYMLFLRDMVFKGSCVFETSAIKRDVLTYLNFTL